MSQTGKPCTRGFPLALRRKVSQVYPQSFNFMKKHLYFCAVLAIFCAQLHAQTGIYVNSNNNVGIGTTSPTQLLHLWGPANVNAALKISSDNGGANSILQVVHPATGSSGLQVQNGSGTALMQFDNNTGNVGVGTTNPLRQFMLYNSYPIIGLQTSGDGLGWGIYSDASDDSIKFIRYLNSAWTSNNNNIFTILPNGNVGIGTTSPAQTLTVNGATAVLAGHAVEFYDSNNGDDAYIFNDGTSAATQGLKYYASGTGGHLFQTYAGYVINALQILNNGNVGVGTTSPAYKLDVAGPVHATSFVSSTTTYADFVFKPGYKLAPLSDVETAIKKEGHLPGIPSEAEAKAHGIDLASMQVKLLQKIEEITLHQIEQQKLLENQTERLDAQSQRIEQLEKENTELRKQR
jgi:hypothetical protein